MASAMRIALLRQSRQLTVVRRSYTQLTQQAPFKLAACPRPALLASQHFHSISSTSSVPFKEAQRSIVLQTANLHTSGRRPILPAGPQVIEGTANEAAPILDPSPTHGSYHWAFERLMSVALIPLTIAPFAAGTLNPVTDAILCATIIIHSHIGFQSIIIDYIPAKRLPKTRALFWWGLRAASLTVAVGLYEFETNDVGLTEAVKRIWTA